MDVDTWFLPDPTEPLAAWSREEAGPDRIPDARRERFELSSRGDRVPGTLWLPPRSGARAPVVVFPCGAPGPCDPDPLEATRAWLGLGAAVACVDLPLHGARASAKLGERALLGLAEPARPLDGPLWEWLVRQAVLDLRRTLDFLCAHPALDAERSLCAASGVGALTGAIFCAVDPRPRAAALASCGAQPGPPALDPARWIGRLAPRPLALIHARSDRRFPPDAAARLDQAAGDPRQVVWLDGEHDVGARTLDAMTRFLKQQL